MSAQSAKTHASPRWSSPLRTAAGELLPSIGDHVCDWIEENCVCGEGDWFGEPARLRPFQQRFIYRLYEYFPSTGRRRYKRALLGIAKGNGKSPIASWVAAHELACLDCAKPSPRVIIGAASLKQANLVFGDLKAATASPGLADLVVPYQLEIQLRNRPGVAERIAAEAGTNDGARATAFIADELHEWQGQRERVFLVVDGAVAKRKDAFTLAITTAGVKSMGQDEDRWDLLNRLYAHGKRVASGQVEDDAFLFEWYEANENLDLDDPAQLREAIEQANPAAGDFNDLENLLYLAKTMPRHEFRRYRLNQFVDPVEEQPIPLERWDECAGEPDLREQEPTWVAVDGSIARDSTAISIAQEQGGQVHTRTEIWHPHPEHGIDHVALRDRLRRLAYDFDVVEIAYDPAYMQLIGQELAEEGLPMVEVRQDDTNMVPASAALFDAVVQGRLVHSGDAELRDHIASCASVQRERGWRLSKRKSRGKTDGAISLALALWRASLADTRVRPNVTSLGISSDVHDETLCRTCAGTGERLFLGEPITCQRCNGTGRLSPSASRSKTDSTSPSPS